MLPVSSPSTSRNSGDNDRFVSSLSIACQLYCVRRKCDTKKLMITERSRSADRLAPDVCQRRPSTAISEPAGASIGTVRARSDCDASSFDVKRWLPGRSHVAPFSSSVSSR